MLLRISAVLFAGLLVAACGTQPTDRALSGAGIGAVTGALAGPVGVAVGAVAGGATGLLTEEDEVYLGEPLWGSGTFD